MKESIHIDYVKSSFDALDSSDQALVKKALEALSKAHAPYSRFHVGSSVLLKDQSVITGNNQENAAYPSGLCAERVALFAAKSQSKEEIQAIAIVARNQNDETADAFACGGCRQVIMEYASMQDHPIRVIMGDRHGDYVILENSKLLLPFHFDSKNLD